MLILDIKFSLVAMPVKADGDFCPPAVYPASQPFATFATEAPLESAEDAADEDEEEEGGDDDEEFDSAAEDSPMETE
ncbi:unnamed protein product [Dibothriocephalus latus]|uniref:Uncharacterized protein n=1 Tax=Dibothriocephalus latus TaxID=60516 RepID=A0A3P7LFE6_DIBLA|nr:unnamed protein product [Dibothriocephalus latus]